MLSRAEPLHWLFWPSSTEIVAEIARTGYLEAFWKQTTTKEFPTVTRIWLGAPPLILKR